MSKDASIHFISSAGDYLSVALNKDYSGAPAVALLTPAGVDVKTLCNENVKPDGLTLPISYVQYENVRNRLCGLCKGKVGEATGSLVENKYIAR